MNAGDWLAQAAKELSSKLDAEVLLAHVFNVSRSQLIVHPEWEVPELPAASLLERRLAGEPVAYIVGRKEFYGRDFLVDRRVLIPRPETETLVEAMIRRLPKGAVCADIGTGSGCIAISLALERPDTRWVATDLSRAALQVAALNIGRVDTSVCPQSLPNDPDHPNAPKRPPVLACADLLEPFRSESLDAVVSNPPYIAPGDPRLEPQVSQWEPSGALHPRAPSEIENRKSVELPPPGSGRVGVGVQGEDGLAAIRSLIRAAPRVLRPGGVLALEFGAGQDAAVRELIDAEIIDDLSGIPRVAIIGPF